MFSLDYILPAIVWIRLVKRHESDWRNLICFFGGEATSVEQNALVEKIREGRWNLVLILFAGEDGSADVGTGLIALLSF